MRMTVRKVKIPIILDIVWHTKIREIPLKHQNEIFCSNLELDSLIENRVTEWRFRFHSSEMF